MRVFVSYSTADGLSVAKKLHEVLHKHGQDIAIIATRAKISSGLGSNTRILILSNFASRLK